MLAVSTKILSNTIGSCDRKLSFTITGRNSILKCIQIDNFFIVIFCNIIVYGVFFILFYRPQHFERYCKWPLSILKPNVD